jgi:protein-histidine pros-kinase
MGDESKAGDEKFFGLLESVPDAIVIVDSQGKIALVNLQTEKLFGYGRAELIGQPVEILIPRRARGKHVDHRERYSSFPTVRPMGAGLDLYALHKDGREFPVEISLSPLRTEAGVLFISSVRDVTERKRFEQTLKEKNTELENAIQAKDRFLASMSHELRTPLNAIIGFTGTLLMKLPGPLTAGQDSQLKTVQSSAKHLLSLINDLLDLAKIESGKVELNFEPVVYQTVIKEVGAVLRPMAEDKGLEFEITLPSEELILMTDRRALSQIVIHLANNAIKFTERGAVRVRLIRARENGRHFTEVAITDSGPGIRAEDQARLFDAFAALNSNGAKRHEGTGLGLYLSNKLATLLNGRIVCDSVYGKGSTFRLLIPES